MSSRLRLHGVLPYAHGTDIKASASFEHSPRVILFKSVKIRLPAQHIQQMHVYRSGAFETRSVENTAGEESVA